MSKYIFLYGNFICLNIAIPLGNTHSNSNFAMEDGKYTKTIKGHVFCTYGCAPI